MRPAPPDNAKRLEHARIIAAAVAALLSLAIFVGTTLAIREGGHTMRAAVPWLMSPEVLRDCFRVPLMGGVLTFGLVGLAISWRLRSHAAVGLVSWSVVTMTYIDGLFRWTAPPPDVLDLRIATTIVHGYVPQTVAMCSILVHGIIALEQRRRRAQQRPAESEA